MIYKKGAILFKIRITPFGNVSCNIIFLEYSLMFLKEIRRINQRF